MSVFDPKSFTHLNVHSHFTLMGSTASIPGLVGKARRDGLSSLALTDSNALIGAIQFNKACEAQGIKPLIGMSLQVQAPVEHSLDLEADPGKLVLIAKDRKGYGSLCRLSSYVQLEAAQKAGEASPLPWSVLSENVDGLLALEGGREGWLEFFLREGALDLASQFLARLAGLFGGSCMVGFEVQTGTPAQVSEEILDLAQRFGTPALPMLPVYCCEAEERSRLRLLTAIHLNCPLDKVPPSRIPGGDDLEITVHWQRLAEMRKRYSRYVGSLDRVSLVLDQCKEPALPAGSPIWPAISLPEGHTAMDVLARLAEGALQGLYRGPNLASAEIRLKHELELIGEGGYAPLFLVVADIARFAREAEIPMNTRGSVANSLVAYVVGITHVDPLEHELLFERFLNPEREDLPDIDLDFCSKRRDEVLDYLRRTYGEDKVAMVATVSTFQPRSAVRETAKAHGYSESQIKRLTAGLSRGWHPDPSRRSRRGLEAAIVEAQDPSDRDVLRAGEKLIGQPRHLSVHPGGVVITPGPLTEVVPIQLAPKGFITTQYDHADIEAVGLPKIDLLGIRALTVISRTVELIRDAIQPDFRLEEIPEADPKTGDLLERGETLGVFQCESEGAQSTLRKLKAREVKDLAIANAFFKPGPATGGMADAFVRRYRGEEAVQYLHPSLKPILHSTQGVLIFQEQILQVATEIAGLSWEAANQLRRGMSKFRPDEMESLKARFVQGCMQAAPVGPGLVQKAAQTLWEQVHAFAGYGFNKGHATSYAGVSYRMAYLKTYWPEAFLCARLSERGGYHHSAVYIAEARRLGIGVRPPHINASGSRFTLTYDDQGEGLRPVLWMGLSQVRDLRSNAVKELLEERSQGPFTDPLDLSRRVKLQDRELVHLIQCGAVDGLVSNRSQALENVEGGGQTGSRLQQRFEFFPEESVESESPGVRMKWERQVLGMPVGVHPLETVGELKTDGIPLQEIPGQSGRKLVTYGARLPSWGGSRTFFVSDPESLLRVNISEGSRAAIPPVWAPIRLEGRWTVDPWGGGRFAVEKLTVLA